MRSGSIPAADESSNEHRATEHRIQDATLSILRRDGVFGALRLNDIAVEAGVNRALVYRHFRSRRGLLRRALNSEVERLYSKMRARQRDLPFVERRLQGFADLLAHPEIPKLITMLVLDGDEAVKVSPLAGSTMARLEQEVAVGDLPPETEVAGVHASGVATAFGYAILRGHLAAELGVPLAELDRQVFAVRRQALDAVVEGGSNPSRRGTDRAHD